MSGVRAYGLSFGVVRNGSTVDLDDKIKVAAKRNRRSVIYFPLRKAEKPQEKELSKAY